MYEYIDVWIKDNDISLVEKDGYLIMSDKFEFMTDTMDAAKNFIKQGYEQLKLIKYVSVIDLLDEGQTA